MEIPRQIQDLVVQPEAVTSEYAIISPFSGRAVLDSKLALLLSCPNVFFFVVHCRGHEDDQEDALPNL
jgi:hypothetical protein